jgi:hypothetical protein
MHDLDPGLVCRDEDCTIVGVHRKHLVRHRELKPHHRAATGARPLWKKDDPTALTGAVARATSRAFPTHFAAIHRDVQDDYGPCSERSVYRHLAKLVERGHLLKLDLGLPCAAYIRPKSRLLRDVPAIREYMLGVIEIHPTTKDEPGKHTPGPSRASVRRGADGHKRLARSIEQNPLVATPGTSAYLAVTTPSNDEEQALIVEVAR